MDKNYLIDNNKIENSSIAHVLELTREEVEDILFSEFGNSIKESIGYDNLLKVLVN